ncbi:MAG: glycoside hydrolase family 57 protein [Armatimonadota bacterium]|nr:glycoside hydrolase family 57 protein [Armatimonadota bacterium]
MTLLVPFFFAHQPFRLKAVDTRPSGALETAYFDDTLNRDIFLRVTERCYRPATRLLLDLVQRHADHPKPFRVAYGLSGTFLMQAERFAPDLLDLWRSMAQTGLVEFTGETYYHSLAGLFNDAETEFRAQCALHQNTIASLFNQTTSVFRNTEMIYNDDLAATVQQMGFAGMMTEGVDWLMAGWRSPDYVYAGPSGLPVLLRNYRLSDDIGFRFANKNWDAYPLTAEKFAGWLSGDKNPTVLLAMDYEALGEHVRADTGIFDFLAALPDRVAEHAHLEWATPSQALAQTPPVGQINVPAYSTISWADNARNTSAWLGNEMQQYCFGELQRLESPVRATGSPEFLDIWRRLQAADHLYYLSSRGLKDGDLPQYFNPYGTVVEAFVRLHTVLYDLKRRVAAFG